MKVLLVSLVVFLSFAAFADDTGNITVYSSSQVTVGIGPDFEGEDIDSAVDSFDSDIDAIFDSMDAAIAEMSEIVIDKDNFKEGQEGVVNTIRVSKSFSADGIEHIMFSGAFSSISSAESATNNIEIEYTIYTDTNNIDQGHLLAKSIEYQMRDTSDILVSSSIEYYSCAFSSASVNGSVTQSVSGACYGDIVVKLPRQSNILISRKSNSIN